jgi:hypothetical protein
MRLKYVINILEPKLCKYITEELGYSKCERIGSGGYGVAYDIGDNKVFKLTSSAGEANSVKKHLLGKSIDGLVKYHDVIVLSYVIPYNGFKNWYGLIMDKVETLSESDIKLLDMCLETSWGFIYYRGDRRGIDYRMSMYHDYNEKNKSLVGSPLWERLVDYMDILNRDGKRALKLFTLYYKASVNLVKQRIIHKDAHSRNVGWDPYGNFVFFDYM